MSNGIQKAENAQVRQLLEAGADRLQKVLAPGLSHEKIIQTVATLCYKNPKLAECEKGSLFAAVMQGAELGLSFSTSLGEAYIVPRWNSKLRINEANFQAGYRGWAKLIHESGGAEWPVAEVVRDGDDFDYGYSPKPFVHHRPRPGTTAPIIAVYAMTWLIPTGSLRFAVLSMDEVESAHARSMSYQIAKREGKPESGPWVTDFAEMCRKTAVHRLRKYLPTSPKMAALADVEEADFQQAMQLAVANQPPPRRTLDAVRGHLGLPVDPPAATAPDADYYAEPGFDDDPEQAGE